MRNIPGHDLTIGFTFRFQGLMGRSGNGSNFGRCWGTDRAGIGFGERTRTTTRWCLKSSGGHDFELIATHFELAEPK